MHWPKWLGLGKRENAPAWDTEELADVLFHPRPGRGTGRLEATRTEVDGAVVGGFWKETPGNDGVLLFFHGNGELAGDWADWAGQLAEAFGASVWLADYRGYGQSTGRPTYGAMLRDAETMWRALGDRERQRGRPFRRRYAMGRSLGSAAAIHVAWRFPGEVAGLAVDSGFARLPALVRSLGRGAAEVRLPRDFADNADKLRSCRMPTLFLHGEDDRLIPIDAARENLAAAGAADKRLVAIPDAGHNDLIWQGGDAYWAALRGLAGA